MAIIGTANDTLILLRDSHRGGPQSNDYKEGDIVQVFSGTEGVTLPPAVPFYLVIVTDLLFADALAYQAAAYNPDGTLINKRIFSINLKRIPKAYKDLLTAQRWFTVPWSSIQAYVESKLG